MNPPDRLPDDIYQYHAVEGSEPYRLTGFKAVPSNEYGSFFTRPYDYVAQYSGGPQLVDYVVEKWYTREGTIARKTLLSDWRRIHGDQTIHPLSNRR